ARLPPGRDVSCRAGARRARAWILGTRFLAQLKLRAYAHHDRRAALPGHARLPPGRDVSCRAGARRSRESAQLHHLAALCRLLRRQDDGQAVEGRGPVLAQVVIAMDGVEEGLLLAVAEALVVGFAAGVDEVIGAGEAALRVAVGVVDADAGG